MTSATWERSLRRLARQHGVELFYVDVLGTRRWASTDALLAVLGALGAVDRAGDVAEALARRERDRATGVIEPTLVAWDGRLELRARVPPRERSDTVDVTIVTESDETIERRVTVHATAGDDHGVELSASLPLSASPGVHQARVRAGAREGTATLVVSPSTSWRPAGAGRSWGVFTPLYALRHARDRGVGTLSDLSRVGAWVGELGARYVATLPLLATFLGEPFEPSPYLPVSRRHWNEAYLDPGPLPEAPGGPAAPSTRMVDWRAVGRATRRVLDAAVAALTPPRAEALDRFLAEDPDVARYARFRAARDDHPSAVRRYEYGQWQVREQLQTVAAHLARRGAGLLLDLPVGTHPEGYDVWDAPGDYARGACVGAPPDDFFTSGQRWGVVPPCPEAGRADGYTRLRATLAAHMSPAAALRVDHVMGLHRLYWVPDGFEARDGVYVRYPAEVQWAVVVEASHRHRCRVVGEDLGTVPASVRRAMAGHGVLGTWVGQFRAASPRDTFSPPRRSVASLSTHDTATTATWLQAHHDRRPPACLLGALGATRADIVVTALDDLWGETARQNVPGTDGPSNWSLRHAVTLDDLLSDPAWSAPLMGLENARQRVAPRGRSR